MQTVPTGFTAEARDSVRNIADSLQVSWHRDSTLSNVTFTIGVSLIGGTGVIGANPGAIGSPSNYRYFDESNYALSLGWERGLNVPIGGISKALANASLDNTSGRFTPRYMGGNSELYTAILPRRPILINAGFNYSGINQTIAQFAGIITEQPQIDMRSRQVKLKASDYIDFFNNRALDTTSMYTSIRSDVLIENWLTQLGMTTAQYDLDTGLQTIGFTIAQAGAKFADLIDKVAQAENGYFYQDESGIFKFENRQHWNSAPYTLPIQNIYTAQVLDSYITNINDSHLLNVVEIKANPREKRSTTTIYTQAGSIQLPVNNTEIFIQFDNPVLGAANPVFTANTQSDGLGSDVTAQVTLSSSYLFAQNAKYTFTNTSGDTAYITSLTVQGRDATPIYDSGIFIREQDDSSVTAYQERLVSIDNDYIQSQDWADSFAASLLAQFSDPENLQNIVIQAKPHLQLGDLISWQGHYWRIFDIKTTLDPSAGLIQELSLLQRTIATYFTIGSSTIAGSDKISS